MPAILYPVWKIVKNFNTIEYSGGTGMGAESRGLAFHGQSARMP